MDRVTHAYDGPLAVFLIGLRVHKPWKVGIVQQAATAMPRMIIELEQNKAAAERGEAEHLGYLGSRSTVHLMATTMIQYWRSVEDIYAYANAAEHPHRPAWLEFYRVAGADPSAVTIWHETSPSPSTGPRASTPAPGRSAWPRSPGPSRSAGAARPPASGWGPGSAEAREPQAPPRRARAARAQTRASSRGVAGRGVHEPGGPPGRPRVGQRFSQVTRRSASRSKTSSHRCGAKTMTGVRERVSAAARRAATSPAADDERRPVRAGEGEEAGAVEGDARGGGRWHGGLLSAVVAPPSSA